MKFDLAGAAYESCFLLPVFVLCCNLYKFNRDTSLSSPSPRCTFIVTFGKLVSVPHVKLVKVEVTNTQLISTSPLRGVYPD